MKKFDAKHLRSCVIQKVLLISLRYFLSTSSSVRCMLMPEMLRVRIILLIKSLAQHDKTQRMQSSLVFPAMIGIREYERRLRLQRSLVYHGVLAECRNNRTPVMLSRKILTV